MHESGPYAERATTRTRFTSEASPDAEAALVRRAQRGDAAAYDALVRVHYRKIAHLVMRYVRDPHESLDVTQEVFLKAYLALAQFQARSSFFTWLFAIAVNTAKNHMQAKKRLRRTAGVDARAVDEITERELWHDESPEKLLLRGELREGLIQALEGLPAKLRAVFILREIDLHSYDEIAKLVGCPIGTVRSRIFRARALVSEALRPLLDSGIRASGEVMA